MGMPGCDHAVFVSLGTLADSGIAKLLFVTVAPSRAAKEAPSARFRAVLVATSTTSNLQFGHTADAISRRSILREPSPRLRPSPRGPRRRSDSRLQTYMPEDQKSSATPLNLCEIRIGSDDHETDRLAAALGR